MLHSAARQNMLMRTDINGARALCFHVCIAESNRKVILQYRVFHYLAAGQSKKYPPLHERLKVYLRTFILLQKSLHCVMTALEKKPFFDESLVLQQLSEGSETAFRNIYERFHATVYRSAERFLQDSDLAEDVVQEVFSTVWVRRSEMPGVRNLEAYIRIVAKNQIYTFLRALSYEHRQMAAYISTADQSISDCDFSILDDQNEQLLESILSSLPERQQEIFKLSRNEGLSHDRIALQLNISPGTVKNHLVRALQVIRQRISPHIDTHFSVLLLLFIKELSIFFN